MTDEGQRREEQERGEKAKRVLENEIFQEAKAVLSQNILNELVNTRPEEWKKREHLYRMIHSLNDVVNYMDQIMRTGEMAREQLEPQENRIN